MRLSRAQAWLAGLKPSDTPAWSSVAWMIFGLCSMLRTTPAADPFVWWSGLVIFWGHVGRLGWKLNQRAS
ncbi:MAG: hypothetical protein SF053_14325 [Bacteroidia bacterium]|nr:hypothetical protein [Bacteroidia bacterium]